MTTQFPNGKCFEISCHASLEWDWGQLLKALGIQIVKANNACSHEERPRIEGYNDHDYPEDLRARVMTMACNESDFDGTNFIFLMNTSDLQHRAAYFAKFRPVIVYLFGQHTNLQLDELAGKVNNQMDRKLTPNIFLVCYAKCEFDYLKPRLYTEIHHRLFYIPFSKKLTDYSGTSNIGRLPFVFTASNAIHRRGDGCGWPQLQQLRNRLPHILTGEDTDVVGGTGRIRFDHLRRLFLTCGVYLTFPAWPAPLVMNLMEAMLAGCPTAFYDNGQGAKEEGVFTHGVGCLSSDVNELYEYCKRCLKDEDFRKAQSALCQDRAIQFWEFSRNLPKWEALFSEMQKLW